MNEEAARALLLDRFHVPRETLDRISAFVDLLRTESEKQNLVARGSLAHVWARHILDSAQLLDHAPVARSWLDLGTGAGFPGLIIAALGDGQVTMVESRKLRVDFLLRAAEVLRLPAATRIVCTRLEHLETERYDAISARAFAPLGKLLNLGERFAAPETRWVLPKGRNAQTELDAIRSSWQGMFHVEPSLTDPEAGIIVAEQVSRTGRGTSSK